MAQKLNSKSNLILISCTKRKEKYPCKAKQMYFPSPYFRKMWSYAKTIKGKVKILSAKYGLIDPEAIIEPYNESLNEKNRNERKIWAQNVINQLEKQGEIENISKIIFLCGKNYATDLKDHFNEKGCVIEDPMKGLGIGQRLAWVKKKISKKENLKLNSFF